MPYEFKGFLQKIFPEVTGTSSKTGKNWARKDMLFSASENKFGKSTTLDTFVSAWGKDCDLVQGDCLGQECEVQVRIESREYNGKWTTGLSLESISFPAMYHDEPPDTDFPADGEPTDSEKDDLPF